MRRGLVGEIAWGWVAASPSRKGGSKGYLFVFDAAVGFGALGRKLGRLDPRNHRVLVGSDL